MCEMKKWMAENRRIILVSLAVALAAFGVMLTCNTLAIDEEKSIIAGEGYSVWIAQGRFMIHEYSCAGVPLFRQLGNRHSGCGKPT